MDSSRDSQTPEEHESVRFAARHVPSHVRFWLVATFTLWLDLWSKSWVFGTLPAGVSRTFVPNVIDFQRSLNDGAVFGSFTGQISLFIVASVFALVFVLYLFARTPRARWLMQIALALILAGALGNLYDRANVRATVVHYKGGSGQVVKRIGRVVSENENAIRIGDWPEGTNVQTISRKNAEIREQGVVRDFIRFVPRFPSWVPWLGGKDMWPWVFNIADAALVCGVGILLVSSWFERGRDGRE